MLTGKCQKNKCLLGYGQPGWLGLEAVALLHTYAGHSKEETSKRNESRGWS